MTSTYELRVFEADGTPIARLTDFGPLSCIRAVNKPGLLSTTLNGDHPVIAQLEHKSHVELWRADAENGIDPYRYFGGLYLKQKWDTKETKRFALTIPGYMWYLSTRYISFYANTADRTVFDGVKAETIMKQLVYYNAGSRATVAFGRLREGAITGLTIQADGAGGNTLDWYCAYKPLLENLQELALIAGGDFDLIKTATNTFQFQWFLGQRGTDRTATIAFSVGKANMTEPVFEIDRIVEKTVAIVGGQGEESDRDIVIRTGTDYAADNDIEIFVSATNISTTEGYNAAGDKKLAETQARKSFTFKAMQTPSCMYGKDYFLGDKVLAIDPYLGTNYSVKIIEDNLKLSDDGSENIDLTLESV